MGGDDLELRPLLSVRNLSIAYPAPPTVVRAVRNATLEIHEGETLALAGETGSGKSTIALAALGLLDRQTLMESGEILFEGKPILTLSEHKWRAIRSRKIGFVFQDARGALNPVLSVKDHLIETIRTHQKSSYRNAHLRAVELLHEVGIPKEQEHLYPHELSGGACQRAGIALAICNNPRLLIADEPTSALDLTIQLQILDLLRLMKQRRGLALFLISHDLPLISLAADRISILYHGRIVESGLKDEIFSSPAHPYTQGLLRSQPGFHHNHQTYPLTPIPGCLPISGEDYSGCAFALRCPSSNRLCETSVPELRAMSATHWIACWPGSAPPGSNSNDNG